MTRFVNETARRVFCGRTHRTVFVGYSCILAALALYLVLKTSVSSSGRSVVMLQHLSRVVTKFERVFSRSGVKRIEEFGVLLVVVFVFFHGNPAVVTYIGQSLADRLPIDGRFVECAPVAGTAAEFAEDVLDLVTLDMELDNAVLQFFEPFFATRILT